MSNYIEIDNRQDIIEAALNEFYSQMNLQARKFKMADTKYLSAHGMHHDQNYSSAQDIATLSHFAMKNPLFK